MTIENQEFKPVFASPFTVGHQVGEATHAAIEHILRGAGPENWRRVREIQRLLEQELPPETGALSDIRMGAGQELAQGVDLDPNETSLHGL